MDKVALTKRMSIVSIGIWSSDFDEESEKEVIKSFEFNFDFCGENYHGVLNKDQLDDDYLCWSLFEGHSDFFDSASSLVTDDEHAISIIKEQCKIREEQFNEEFNL